MKEKQKVFIIHGHDTAVLQELARTLALLGLKAVILQEQADHGRTLFEKLEDSTNADFVVVLYTGCDLGRAKDAGPEEAKPRARQNVLFEHGFCLHKLGRKRVCFLVEEGVEIPSDLSGLTYIPLDSGGAWRFTLAGNMKAAGLQVDVNDILRS